MKLPFTIRQLEIFNALRTSKSFTTTSVEFGISQAAVSQHIHALEQAVGTALFVRRAGQRPALTSAGQAFARDMEDFKRVVEKLASHRRESLDVSGVVPFRIFVGPVLLDLFIKPRIDTFAEQNPNIQLEIDSGFVDLDLIDRFTNNAYDFVIYNRTAAYHSAIGIEHDPASNILASFTFGIFAHSALLGDASPPYSKDFFKNLPFVLWTPGKGVRIDQERTLDRAGIHPGNIVARTQYYEVFLKMIERGVGAGLTSECFLSLAGRKDLSLCWPVSPTLVITRRRPDLAAHTPLDTVEQFLVSSIIEDDRCRAAAA